MTNNYFFVNPSFVGGMARILDLGGTFDGGAFLISATPAEADARAANADLRSLLEDFTRVIETDEREPQAQAA